MWDRGLLKKGPGLCHGISGGAYAFLRLRKTTGRAMWLHRAWEFARFMNRCDALRLCCWTWPAGWHPSNQHAVCLQCGVPQRSPGAGSPPEPVRGVGGCGLPVGGLAAPGPSHLPRVRALLTRLSPELGVCASAVSAAATPSSNNAL